MKTPVPGQQDQPASAQPAEWYYMHDRTTRHGPVTLAQMQEWVAARRVLPEDIVWRPGMADWATADKVPLLFPPSKPRAQTSPSRDTNKQESKPKQVSAPQAANDDPLSFQLPTLEVLPVSAEELLAAAKAKEPSSKAIKAKEAPARPLEPEPTLRATDLVKAEERSLEEPRLQDQATLSCDALLPFSPVVEKPAPEKPRIIGCPRCLAKLRTRKPGLVRCPRCLAKLRVAAKLFPL